jgi:transcriptional regulator with XRE-family HTH domain
VELTINSTNDNIPTKGVEKAVDKSFGRSLRELRRRAGLSQRELADRTGLDFSYISKIENGRVPPPAADTVLQISQALGEPASGLLALTGKLPSDVAQTVSSSPAAQDFLRAALQMRLTDEEWRRLTTSMRTIRQRRG